MSGLLVKALIVSTTFLLPQLPPVRNLSNLPPCPQTCGRAQRCCELGCPPSADINCSASYSDPTGQCINSFGIVEDVLVLSCSCSVVEDPSDPTGVAYQTNCADN